MLNRLMTSRRVRGILLTVVLLSAVQMFRASGAMELLTGLLSPVLEGLGHLAWGAVAFRGKLAGYVDGIL